MSTLTGPLKLVPFNSTWIAHDKIDIHAIYRRPRFVEDEYGEWARQLDPNGVPMWDLTGPLPVKQDNKWRMKGFEYVTLANRDSLITAARYGTLLDQNMQPTSNWQQYDQHQTGGPWNYRKYHEGQTQTTTIAAQELENDIRAFGWQAVESIRRRVDPTFRVAEHLKQLSPEAQTAAAPAAKPVEKKAEKAAEAKS
jgi:hypothetical protein